MKASVLVVGYKQADIIPYLLKGYDLQSNKEFEVIYVENGAGEDERGIKALKSTKVNFPLRKIVNHGNETLGACWNMAAHQATGDLLIFTHGDIIPDRFLVEKYLQKDNGKSVLAGVRHHINPEELKSVTVDQAFVDYEQKWVWHTLSKMVWQLDIVSRFMDDIIEFHGRPYYLVSGSNMAMPKKIFNQIGGCDGKMTSHAPVDWDLALKAWADGYEFRYVPGAIAFQVESPVKEKERDAAKRASLKTFFAREKTVLGRIKHGT